MSANEIQLETWSHQGSKAQSAATYEAVKRVLEDGKSPYASKSFEIFLQGSYGNDTNIYADSDVDIVICLTSTYYYENENLDAQSLINFNSGFSESDYSLATFRQQVLEWLKANFGTSVVDGKKAIRIDASGSRRDADVLACALHRDYHSYADAYSPRYHEGIAFWPKGGTKIVNYPKQHRLNCTSKHQDSYFRFKPTVRILKNYRNSLIERGRLQSGVAPSYFLEGLLHNFPNSNFRQSHTDTMTGFMHWLTDVDVGNLTCANERHYLVRDGHPICWNSADFETFRTAVRGDW